MSSFDRMLLRGASPAGRDPARVFRLVSGVVTLCAAGGVAQAVVDRGLPRRTRLVGGGLAAVGLSLGVRGVTAPGKAAGLFFEHRRRALLLGAVPVAASPLLTQRYNALHMLPVAGVAAIVAVVGVTPRRRTGATAAITGYWVAQAAWKTDLFRDALSEERVRITVFIQPLAIVAAARIAPDLLRAARELVLLADKLALAEQERTALEGYRIRVLAALRRAHQVAYETSDGIAGPDDPQLALDTLLRATGRIDERQAVLEAARDTGSNVETLLRARVASALATWTALQSSAPEITVSVDVGRLDEPRVLGLVASTVATALCNARRHGVDVRNISVEVSNRGPLIDVIVTNDGSANEAYSGRAGRGLQSKKVEAHILGGTVEWGPLPTGGWAVRLRDLPAHPVVEVHAGLTSADVLSQLDNALTFTTRAMAIVAGSVAVTDAELAAHGGRLMQAANIAVLAGYEGAERAGWWKRMADDKSPTRRSARVGAAVFLSAAAVVSRLSAHRENTVLSGWANSALSRHGLFCNRAELAALIAAHAYAIVRSHVGTPSERVAMAAHQVSTLLLGPAFVTISASAARRGLERRETDLQQALSESSQLHDLAEQIHATHSALEPLHDLRNHLARRREQDQDYVAALDGAIDALEDARKEVGESFSAATLARQFAQVVAARVWPAQVELELDTAELRQVSPSAIAAMSFRRRAFDVADQLGEALLDALPYDWAGRSTLRSVRLVIGAVPDTNMLELIAIPDGSSMADSATIRRLAATVADAGGTLEEGIGDGRITFCLSPPDQRPITT